MIGRSGGGKNPTRVNSLYSISPLTIVIMGFQIFISSLLALAIIMLLKLYYRTRKVKYISLSSFPITALMSGIATILSNFNVKGAWEFSYLSNILLGAAYLSFPIIIFLEIRLEAFGKKLKLEQKRAEYSALVILFTPLFHLFCVPVNLPTDASDDFYFPRPQGNS